MVFAPQCTVNLLIWDCVSMVIVSALPKDKTSVISSYVKRALSHCSTWNDVHQKLEHVAQQLVDNGYTNKEIQRVTRTTLDRWYVKDDKNAEDTKQKIKLLTGALCARTTKKMRRS